MQQERLVIIFLVPFAVTKTERRILALLTLLIILGLTGMALL